MKKFSIDLTKELLEVHNEDKVAFVRLVASMVDLLENPEFREVAAKFSSWPVNVPALATRGKRKIPQGAPKRTWMISREGKCHQVLDEQLRVGSGLTINLFPAKNPKLDDPMTGLAYEVALIMAAVHARNTAATELCPLLGIDPSEIERISELQKWCDSVKNFVWACQNARSSWIGLGFRFAQIRYGQDLSGFTGLQRWVEGLQGQSIALRSKTIKGRVGVLKGKFNQAFRQFLKRI